MSSKVMVSVRLLIIQIALFVGTAWLVPARLRLSWLWYFLYTLASAVLWIAYSLAVLFFDKNSGNDVPAIGYLLLGTLAVCNRLGCFRDSAETEPKGWKVTAHQRCDFASESHPSFRAPKEKLRRSRLSLFTGFLSEPAQFASQYGLSLQ